MSYREGTCSARGVGEEMTTAGALCGPAIRVMAREALGERWCFTCRTRLPFWFIVRVPTAPSYYGPTPGIECEAGHIDGDCFPGTTREWD